MVKTYFEKWTIEQATAFIKDTIMTRGYFVLNSDNDAKPVKEAIQALLEQKEIKQNGSWYLPI